MIDVRAPVEFHQGAFPHVDNLPLMDDDDRREIGIRYKESGQEQAILLGKTRVSGNVKTERVDAWANFVRNHPQGVLYCFRGGLRSKISQFWIYEKTGIIYPRVKGGYKAMRHFLLETLQAVEHHMQAIVIGGRTGTGKTLLLNQTQHKIDLEGIYHHRGSAFGNHAKPQPSQIDIENALAIAWLKLQHAGVSTVIMEDEAANIGSRRIPDTFIEKLKTSPLILLEEDIDTRANNVFNDYIVDALQEHRNVHGEEIGNIAWAENLRASLRKIERRLGGKRFQDLNALLEEALLQHRESNETDYFRSLIRQLLVDYYDPMYDFQLAKKTERVIFKGDTAAVLSYLREHHQVV